MASDRSVRDTKESRTRFLERPRNNRVSVVDGNEITKEDERDCAEELLKTIW